MKNIVNMFQNHPWLRRVIPVVVIIGWLAVAGIGGPTFGKISDIESNDQSTFLPSSAESTKVATIQKEFRKSDTIPAIVVIASDSTLSNDALRYIAQVKDKLAAVDGVASAQKIAGPIPSQDKKAVELIVPVRSSAEVDTVVDD